MVLSYHGQQGVKMTSDWAYSPFQIFMGVELKRRVWWHCLWIADDVPSVVIQGKEFPWLKQWQQSTDSPNIFQG